MSEIKFEGQETLKGVGTVRSEVILNEPYRPFRSNEVNNLKAEEWIISKPEDQQIAARAVVDNISHIGQEEFERRLGETVEDFNEKIGDEKYVTIVADLKSNEWSLELAWQNLITKPDYVGNTSFFEQKEKNVGLADYIKQNGIKKVAIFDDAIYSGQQIHTLIDQFREMGLTDMEFVLVVPFISNYGEERLRGIGTNLTICNHQEIKSVAELIPDKEIQNKILEIREFSYITNTEDIGDLSTRTLTYFDHKVPDKVSTLNFARLDFIPRTSEPYKEDFVGDYLDLLIEQGLAERFDLSGDDEKPFWNMEAMGYKIGDEYWIRKRAGSRRQIIINRGEEEVLVENGKYFKLEEVDVLSQALYKDWEGTEYPAETKKFLGDKFI